ncbi:MAG TPA: pyridoxamine 5'-phosphate oxidase family protein [Methylophilaceae bacterium]|jgi:predicted pyridoxine 5'-phosphate oxidase superfamily flavin-nucleotide-binding protein
MSRLFGPQHRELQDIFGTRKLADRIEEIACKTEIDEETKAFIEAQDMFFLASVDHNGRPTVSYKGGDVGLVKVIDSQTLVFPNYDGNGMYMSVGNLALNKEVGMLFISFETPHRIRVQGTATVSREDPLLEQFPGADLLVRVKLSELWQNCPRYIHRYQRVQKSRYVPTPECPTPLAGWKQTDIVQDVLPPGDAAKAQEAGIIPVEQWMEKVKSGDPTA